MNDLNKNCSDDIKDFADNTAPKKAKSASEVK